MDRLASMQAFVCVVEKGSFAGAASVLGISAQMVAKHVAYLETRAGTRLVNRTTRRQSLTEIGRAFGAQCRIVLAEASRADELPREIAASPRGCLRISAPVTFGTQRLVPMVADYLRRFPDVEVDLVLSDRLVDLIEDGFEAAFRIGPLPHARIAAHALEPFRLVACAAPAYLAAQADLRSPDDLRGHECLGYSEWPKPEPRAWRFTRDGRAYEVAPTARLRINDAKALLAAALAGCGIALIAEDLARDALADGRLRRVLPAYEPPARPMHLVHLPDSRPTPKLRSFVEAALRSFGA